MFQPLGVITEQECVKVGGEHFKFCKLKMFAPDFPLTLA